MKMLKKGDRIQLLIPLLDGYKGKGTVLEDQCRCDDKCIITFVGDDLLDPPRTEYDRTRCMACRDDVELLEEPRS